MWARVILKALTNEPVSEAIMLQRALSRATWGLEVAFTSVWSLGELAYAFRRPQTLWRDPGRQRLREDIEAFGLYKEFPGEVQEVRVAAGGRLVLDNPYRRPGEARARDRVVAWMARPAARRSRHVVVVCHCYGVPFAGFMQRLFGLGQLHGVDVVYNVMNHHYFGSYVAWPGAGLASPRLSDMVHSFRSAITGLRSLTRSLVATFGYDSVSVLGYSVGGQLALHLANCHPLRRAVLYCPVVCVRQTCSELGVMRYATPLMAGALGRVRRDFDMDDLAWLDPLAHEPATDPARMTVVAQRNDVMVPLAQVARVRARHPAVEWVEHDGTHLVPSRWGELTRLVRARLEPELDELRPVAAADATAPPVRRPER